MRRVARRLFTLCSAVSLLLCVAVCVLWVRSYWRSDELVWTTAQLSGDGRRLTFRESFLKSSRGWWTHGQYVDDPHEWIDGRPELTSFEWRRASRPLDFQIQFTAYGSDVPIPYWLTVLTLLAPMAIRVTAPVLNRRGRRAALGLCPSCGYDLRGSPDRCPECGTAVERAQVAAGTGTAIASGFNGKLSGNVPGSMSEPKGEPQ